MCLGACMLLLALQGVKASSCYWCWLHWSPIESTVCVGLLQGMRGAAATCCPTSAAIQATCGQQRPCSEVGTMK